MNNDKKYFLKKVIRRVTEKSKCKTEYCKNTRYPLKKNIMEFISKKDVKYYEVYNNEDRRNYAEHIQNVSIIDFDTGLSIEIILRYRLSCPVNEEESVTCFLAEEESPEEALIEFIDKLVHQYYDENSIDFVENIDQNLIGLAKRLDNEIKVKSGLLFMTKISLKHVNDIHALSLEDSLTVKPKGMEKDISLQYSYILNISNKNLASLYYNNEKQTIDTIKIKTSEAISSYISRYILAQKLFFNFINIDKEMQELIKDLNHILTPYGRTITIKKMKIENIDLVKLKEIEIENHSVPTDRGSGGSDSILIKNKLQFELEDAGLYIEANTPDLDKWANEALSDIFSKKVFDWEYVDFLESFDDLKSNIEEEMRKKASLIGYTINQIVSEPRLPENKLLNMETYIFDYKKLATLDSGISADFKITLTFMLNDKTAFKQLLRIDTDFKISLDRIFETELTKILSYESPERIFLQYYTEKFQDKNISLKSELERSVVLYLEDKLNATVQEINIVPVDNGLLNPLIAVRGKSQDFVFQLVPKIIGDPINYTATLFIKGHDNSNWIRLIEGNYTVESITKGVITALESNFSNTVSEEVLHFSDFNDKNSIQKAIDSHAKEFCSKYFGLEVNIENLDRGRSEDEELMTFAKQKERKFIAGQKGSNLDLMAELNAQKREQLLDLSHLTDDEDKEVMNNISEQIGLKDVSISIEEKYMPEKNFSGKKRLEDELQSKDNMNSHYEKINHLEQNTDQELIENTKTNDNEDSGE